MTTSNLELWNRSHWLSNAAQVYAKSVFKSLWVEEIKETTHWSTRFKASAEKAVENGLEGMEVFAKAVYETAPKPSPNTELLKEANQEILKQLRLGVYRGFGFDRARTMETKPVVIPKEAWINTVLLQGNELSFQSLKFVDVRIRMVSVNADPLLSNPDDEKAPQVGRPSLKEPILQAFWALHKRGAFDFEATLKCHWPKVRQQLVEDNASLPKPASDINDETFRRYLSSEINILREGKKQ